MNLSKLLKILLLITCFYAQNTQAQVIKKKAVYFTFRILESGVWSDWEEFVSSDVLIVVDATENRIKIFSKEEQVYDVISSEEPYIDKDGDEFIEFTCIDNEGLRCTVVFSTIYSKGGFEQVYVRYSNFQFVYNVKNIE